MADFSSFLLGGSPEKSKYSVEDVQNMVFGQESNFGKAKTDTANYAGAVGPMQITKPTFEGLKKKGLIPVEYDINNPTHNKEAGNVLISDAYNRHGGDADKVLAEYYAGPDVIKNGQIQTDWKDLKNPKAPNVGQYIEQAKSKIGEMSDDFSRFLMGASASKPEETKNDMNWFQRGMNAPEAAKKLTGAGEAAASLVANPVVAVAGMVKGIAQSLPEIAGGKAPQIAQKIAKEFQDKYGFSPTSEEGKNYLKSIGETVESLIQKATGSNMSLPPIMPEMVGIMAGRNAAGQIEKQFKNISPTKPPEMVGVGAAQTNNANILNEAINRAQSPELKTNLAKLNPNEVNPVALERRLEADTLPIPIKLTSGQASQDANLISRERNERGFKEPLVQHFNEQNKALMENAALMKDRVAPDVFTESHVADAQGLIGKIEDQAKSNAEATKLAYKDLKDASGGQFPVDGRLFADNAINILNAEDRLDYLPINIQRKLNDYQSGKKTMNFNLFENLRTDLASEIRKAQRAGDGNQAYVLGQVRGELEKLPMVGETAEIKILADKARGLAKADFDLEAQNKIYSDVVNGKADTKNFISKNVINSPNKDFADTMALVANDPIARQHLASGTLDLIIRDSTDASGNFNTGKFSKHIENLNVNGKLKPLFGEEANTLMQIARTGQAIEARPRGAFVNESNTLVGALAENAKNVAETGTNIAFKGLPVGTIGRKLFAKRTLNKELKETLSPTGGIKLKDIGK